MNRAAASANNCLRRFCLRRSRFRYEKGVPVEGPVEGPVGLRAEVGDSGPPLANLASCPAADE